MSAFSIRDIDDLKPQGRRYDVPIEDDFVVSVLPNGIRTWVYVYEQDGRLRRRTLGIYPDMGAEQAHQSLAAARTTRRSLQDMERSHHAAAARAGAARVPARHSPAVPAGVLVVAVIVALGIYLAAKQFDGTDAEEAVGRVVSAPSAQNPPASTDGSVVTPRLDEHSSTAAHASTSPATPVAQHTTVARPTAALVPERATPAPQDAASAANESAGPSRARHVARAMLTSDVVKHEPVDTIGPEIQGDRDSAAYVCFYTELRGLSGQQVRYRWEREGRVESENTILVGTSWRWRAYSRKEILPSQTGQWRVQLMDADDRVLAEASFLYRTDPLDKQAAEAD